MVILGRDYSLVGRFLPYQVDQSMVPLNCCSFDASPYSEHMGGAVGILEWEIQCLSIFLTQGSQEQETIKITALRCSSFDGHFFSVLLVTNLSASQEEKKMLVVYCCQERKKRNLGISMFSYEILSESER